MNFNKRVEEEAIKLRPQYHEEYQFVKGAHFASILIVEMLRDEENRLQEFESNWANWLESKLRGDE